MKKLKVILIGAGGRGNMYTSKMTEDKYEVIAVADPNPDCIKRVKDRHRIPDNMCFRGWEEILSLPKFADIAIIATSDKQHFDPVMKAISLGYDILLEKPAAPTAKECLAIADAATKKGVKVLVCHVLRYTPFFSKIKEMISNGDLGEIISVHHNENVGFIHHSHSYVRGNWGNTERSSNMLLAKSCHDIDIMQWLIDSKCVNVQSFGSLSHFKAENAPEESTEYCIDCPLKGKCYYDATKIYSPEMKEWYLTHATKKDEPTEEDIRRVLTETQYGKCVYKCDNDVVDHQVVNLEYENGAVASFNMSSFNDGGRYIRIMGTKGEIFGNMNANTLDFYSFDTMKHEILHPWELNLGDSIVHGHGGGDDGIIETLYDYIANGYEGNMLSKIEVSVDNHLTVFAAEKSRLEKTVVNMDEFKKSLN